MNAAEIVTKKNAELVAFAKEELGDKVPGDIGGMERSELLELVKGIVDKKVLEEKEAERVVPTSPTAPTVEPGKVDTIKSDGEALDMLRIMGFDGLNQVKAYLKGVEREKQLQVQRIEGIEMAHKELDKREAQMKKREQDIDAKGKQVLEDLLELRKVRDQNSDLLRNREALSQLS
jgi:hypothetical protein